MLQSPRLGQLEKSHLVLFVNHNTATLDAKQAYIPELHFSNIKINNLKTN